MDCVWVHAERELIVYTLLINFRTPPDSTLSPFWGKLGYARLDRLSRTLESNKDQLIHWGEGRVVDRKFRFRGHRAYELVWSNHFETMHPWHSRFIMCRAVLGPEHMSEDLDVERRCARDVCHGRFPCVLAVLPSCLLVDRENYFNSLGFWIEEA